YDTPVALSSGAIMTTASWISTAVLFVVSLPFAWGSLDLEATPQAGGDSKLVWIILALVVLIGLVVGLALAVPRLRRLAAEKMRPKLRDMWANLKAVASSPGRLVQLLGGACGLGVVEAGMILGLTAAGVSEADATAAVFIQRLFTSYLPPIWGWATLVWMRKREY